MAYSVIDIGSAATDRNTSATGVNYTRIDANNPANATGVLTSFEMWAYSQMTGVKIGTFSGSHPTFNDRDYETIGTVAAYSKQTFTGKNCDVSTGDFIGYYHGGSGGELEATYPGGAANAYYVTGDKFGLGAVSYSVVYNYSFSAYATGVTIPDAPTSVSATDNLFDKITITWTAGTGETDGHRVYRDGVDVSGVVAHGTATFDDTTAVAGTTYAYTVKAINAAGLSAASTADNGTRVSSGSSIPVLLCSLGEY